MFRILCALTFTLLVTGCVTEGYVPPEDGGRKEVDPVAQVETAVEGRIARLATLTGQPLLKTIQEILSMKDLARKPVLAALPGADDRTRAHLIYILGYIGDGAARDVLAAELTHRNPVVRYEAAAALAGRGDMTGVPVLINFLDADDRQLRYKSFQVLKGLSQNAFGYDFQGEPQQREQAIAQWQGWWRTRRSQLMLDGE